MPARCFLAITLPEPAIGALVGARAALLDESPGWAGEKWVRPELLHVTVAFFGSVPDEELDGLLDRLRTIAAAAAPFTLHLTGARAVPSQRRASMVWALLEGDVKAVSDLRDEALAVAGCAADHRRFSPHVTLVRTRRTRRLHHTALQPASDVLSAAGKTPVGTVSVPSLTVFSSTYDGVGPSYRVLARIALAAAPGTPSAD